MTKIKVGKKYTYKLGDDSPVKVKVLDITETSDGKISIKYRYGFLGPVFTDSVKQFEYFINPQRIIIKHHKEI